MSQINLNRHQNRFVSAVEECWRPLTQLNDIELANFVESIREKTISKPDQIPDLIPSIVGVSKEAIRRHLGWELYDVQVLASQALIHCNIAEMQTGEGKTIAAVAAAVFGGLQNRGTHVSTTTPYLAQRDFEQLKPVYESLGLTVGLLEQDKSSASNKKPAYDCDITYGPGFEFGFDYLRDQVALKHIEEAPLGQQLLTELTNRDRRNSAISTRGHFCSIVDEADNVLVDDASSPLVLSEFQAGTAPDADAVRLAINVASTLVPNEHFLEVGPLNVELTESGRNFIYNDEFAIPVAQLVRPWASYVETALRAANYFHRDVHYVVKNGKARIVDGTTGRIFDDRSWQAGLHQAIEAKEMLEITPEKLPLAQITRQRFFGLYKSLSGMTGTATNCKSEFNSVYGVGVSVIPLRLPSKREIVPMRVFASAEQKWDEIADSVFKLHQERRPVLIGTRTIAESEVLSARLASRNLTFQVLNGKQDADEAEIIAIAGHRGAITIATNLAGRGTDIKLGNDVEELGGLHVIASECHESQRIDRQLIGRCARQGNPGSAQFFVSAEDWLIQTHGEWLQDAIKKLATSGEVNIDLASRIRRIQGAVERQQSASRLATFQQSDRKN